MMELRAVYGTDELTALRAHSFGQSCEGEPLMQADLLCEVIANVRKRTKRGTIHVNTNGTRTSARREHTARTRAIASSCRVRVQGARSSVRH
jgi:wyosine [tRNA(Phe)-imidazoG37] synthetase (radical SAM superfamily)